MFTADLNSRIQKLPIPVYFISGIYDYTVSYTLSEEFLKKLEAPVKGFYTLTHSAHSPLFEEPEKFVTILTLDVLQRLANLADNDYNSK
jgi:pimeloyl-ACP methyl ester carboxylesterase